MMNLFHPVFFWLMVLFAVVAAIWVALMSVADAEEDYTPKVLLAVFGLLALLSVVTVAIYLLLREVCPDWSFLHGQDENGEPTDRLLNLAGLISLPVTYLLIRGFGAWRKDLKENKHL